jgi:hypothetical protein
MRQHSMEFLGLNHERMYLYHIWMGGFGTPARQVVALCDSTAMIMCVVLMMNDIDQGARAQ